MRSAGKNRRDEIVISRMRFGRTRLNSTLYKMGKHDTGRCEFVGKKNQWNMLFCTVRNTKLKEGF